MKVIVTGSLSFDYIMDFPGRFADRIMPDKIHSLSLSFLADKLNKQYGGTAGNVSYTLKLLGIDPVLASCAGNDFGPFAGFFKKCGIGTDNIYLSPDCSTSAYFVITDNADNQIDSFYIGAAKYTCRIPLEKLCLRENPKPVFTVLAPTDSEGMIRYVEICSRLKIRYMYDPAFQIATFTASDLACGIGSAEILIGNDYEIALIENKLGISHEKLRSMVPVLVMTLGAKGSVVEKGHESVYIKPARPGSVTDPTGAGDAYRAGFVAGYVRGYNRSVCGQMGSVAAVYTVEKYGTVTHKFSKKQFCRRYFENYHEMLKL